MKTSIFIVSVAALFVTSCQYPLRTAHAVDLNVAGCSDGACRPQVPERPLRSDNDIPRSWSGRWCYDYVVSTKAVEVYFPPNLKDRDRTTCGDLTDGIMLDVDGYDEETASDTQNFCSFTTVKEKEKLVSYLVHMRCTTHDADEQADYEEDVEFELVNELLFIKRKPSV